MSYLLYTTLVACFALVLALVVVLLLKRLTERSLENWGGTGHRDDLEPEEAAVILSLGPGVVFSVACLREILLGGLQVEDPVPLVLAPVPDAPHGPFGAAVRRAIGPDGAPDPDGVVDLLEEVWESANGKMEGFSGSLSAKFCREKIDGLWEAVLARRVPGDEEALLWLFLREPNEVWDRMPRGGDWDRLRDLYRIRERVGAAMVLPEPIQKLRFRAKRGYFRWYRARDYGRPLP